MQSVRELQAERDALVVKNQELGASIDKIRDERRAINRRITQIEVHLRMSAALVADPALANMIAHLGAGDGSAPGAELEVSVDLLKKAAAQALADRKMREEAP